MGYFGIGYESLKKVMRTESSKDFGVSFSRFDRLLILCCGLLAVGVAGFAVRQELPMQMAPIAAGAIYVLSLFLAYRMMVPFVLRITQTDMLRVYHPFYVWLSCCLVAVCTSDPFLELLVGRSGSLLQLALTILSAASAIEHFRKGRTRYLFLSAGVAGVVVGLSSFGVFALVLLVVILLLLRHMLWLELECVDGPVEVELNWVFERLISPSALSGVRFVMAVCFFLGVAASISGRMLASGIGVRCFESFPREWLQGLSIDGVVVLIGLGILPLLLLSRVRIATDTLRFLGFAEQARYFIVMLGTGAFLLLGDGVLKRLQVPIAVDARYWMLGMAIGGFSFLVSAMVLVVDAFCRVPRRACQSVGRKNPISRFCQLALLIAPVVLVCVGVFLRVRHGLCADI